MNVNRIGRFTFAGITLTLAASCAPDATGPSKLATSLARDVAAAAAPGTVLVLPTATPNLFTQGWFGYPDRGTAVGLASIGTSPATQALGYGSLNISNTAFGWEVASHGTPPVPPGTRMDAITELAYSTYTPSGQPGITVQHVALQFTIDYDVNDAYAGFQGRLVFEPYSCNSVGFDAWAAWNTMDGATTGCWWQTANPSSPATPASADRAPWVGDVRQTGALPCPQANPCTWAEVVTAYPNAGFHATNTANGIILKVGSTWSGSFFADAVAVGVNGSTTTFDFEPYDVAGTTAECLKGGWQGVTRADGSTFKNQGDCVSYVQNGK